MGAFDKIKSGIPSMDQLLDHIRMGDNVVWSVSNLEEFRFFTLPFVKQAIQDGRNVIYMRFADHDPILPPMEGLKICQFNPDKGFESFTVDIYQRITEEGRDAFYVFDCLSSLQSVWYTDLMMGNFFQVTCPYLFKLDTVAYFPIIRGQHSFDAVARIRDTTQLFLDVYSSSLIYLHPLKVWNRYSPKMFMTYACSREEKIFRPLSDGVALSKYYQLLEKEEADKPDQNYDSHDRFFSAARLAYRQGTFSPETEQQILESTMTKDPKLQKMVKQYFTPEDYFKLRDRMIGSGAIGGKACGMLLARKIIRTHLPEYLRFHEPHDSFYIGSDVFYTYIVSNNCWETRIAQRTDEGYFKQADALKQALLSGTFPSNIQEKFRTLLDYYSQSPIIVRSSSFLEDGFGNAFAGKYESVFCVNRGTLEERLQAFEDAVRQVYASTMDISALEYRKLQGLEHHDEQMAVLVQRVSGCSYGNYFFPAAAGVGYSRSLYKLDKDMDPSAGLLRIVAGLGTRAVDRTENDYPRLVNLDRPSVSMYPNTADRHRFSQRNLDVLDIENNALVTLPLESLLPSLPRWLKQGIMERDEEAENALRRMGRQREVWFISCQGLLENKDFTEFMQKTLKTLEKAYENPVDIEYTVNMDQEKNVVVNLVQCRPLYTGKQGKQISIPNLPQDQIFFQLQDSSMGSSAEFSLTAVVEVDPVQYYCCPYAVKPKAAQAIGRINAYFRQQKGNILLTAPGRLGTSSPELGVPVTFSHISGFRCICEVSDSRAGYMPELSYGSHMFQDLVEADIIYNAIWNDNRTLAYHPQLLKNCRNLFPNICPDMKDLFPMIKVYETPGLYYWNDALSAKTLCGYKF